MLERLQWKPQSTQEKNIHAVATGNSDTIADLGEDAIEPLVLVVSQDAANANEAVKKLTELGAAKELTRLFEQTTKAEKWTLAAAIALGLGELGEKAQSALDSLAKYRKARVLDNPERTRMCSVVDNAIERIQAEMTF